MSNKLKKVFYVLSNPLDCLFHAKDVMRSFDGHCIHVVLPKYIDPSRFEALLLNDTESFGGVTIDNISSFPANMLGSAMYLGLQNRVDQIALSEHFNSLMPKGLVRPLLNAVLELKHAYFEHDYLRMLLDRRKEKEGGILLEVFNEYQGFLRKNNVVDAADVKRIFIDEVKTPGSKLISENDIFIFAGFNEFSSYDLDVISAVSSRAFNTIVVGADIFNIDVEYSRRLLEQFVSMGFSKIQVEDRTRSFVTLHEFSNINDEVHYVCNNMKEGTVYAVNDVDNYYSLLRYYLGEQKISINAAMRLDRSSYLRIFTTILLLNDRGWTGNDVIKLLNFLPFWEGSILSVNSVLSLSKVPILPRGYLAWQQLAQVQDAKNVMEFFKKVQDKVPLKAPALDYSDLFTEFFANINDAEKESVLNLVSRVAECLGTEPISSQVFVRKIYDHAEENYVFKDAVILKPMSVTLASLVCGNTSSNVWFAGMNKDAFSNIANEDVVINDNFILAFRSEGFLLPTSKEKALIASKIIKDASSRSNVSYVNDMGSVVDFFKDVVTVKHKVSNINVLHGAISQLDTSEPKLLGHELKGLSASLIKAYMDCPYACMASNVLKANKQATSELKIDVRVAGTLLHRAMELLLPMALDGRKLNIQAELSVILQNEFSELRLHPLREVFLKYYSSILENLISHQVEFIQENGLKIFNRTESEFKVHLDVTKGLGLKGKIDRVDIDEQNNKLHVVDYKTSKIPSGIQIKNGEDIQLALYIMAMASDHPEFEYDGHYVSMKELKSSPMNILSLENARTFFAIHGVKAIQGLCEGTYPARPIDTSECEKCDYRRCCGAV